MLPITISCVVPQIDGAFPSFFRACCREAAQQNANGIRVGYDHPGYQLTASLHSVAPYELSSEEWDAALDELIELLRAANDAGVIIWYCRWLPRCMELVPRRRRRTFLRGVYRAAVNEGWIVNSPDR